MERVLVTSSNIRSIGYDRQSATLEVEFTSGDVYRYFDVPEHLYQQFLQAPSYGQFLNDNIRYSYRYQKIRDFICWKKELERKGDPSEGAPKL